MALTSISIAKSGLKTSLIEALYNEILTNSNSYYYFLGRTLPYNEGDTVETPDVTAAYEAKTRDDIIFMKKVTSADVSYIIPRYDWVSGNVYDMYDDAINATNPSDSGAVSLETSNFYAMTPDFHIYKCINNNNGGASTVQPYGTSYKLLTLSDGYTWKYMYTVPISSQNKFMSLYDIPVTTAIKNQYYSRGSITSATVNAYGTGYSVGDTLVVTGNGYLESSPIKVSSIAINTPGSGYDSPPTITFADAYTNKPFTLNTPYILGQYVKYGNNIYLVVSAGTSSTTVYPTHTSSDPVYNGSLSLQYVSTTLTGTTTVSSGEVTGVVLSGIIGFINITNPGYGYSGNPGILVSGDGSSAEVSAVITNTRIINTTITNRGTGYTNATVVFDEPVTANHAWSSGGTVAVNDVIKYVDTSGNTNYYQVTTGTTLGTSPPTHTSGSATNGTTTLLFIAARATGTVDVYYGYGYLAAPLATIDPPGSGVQAKATVNSDNTSAKLTPVIENGQIVSVIATEPGIGYTAADIAVVSATGSGAQIVANIALGDLNTNQANVELLATPGTVDSVKVTNGGAGYSYANVTINGDGSGATATATVLNGTVHSISITGNGTGYTKATIVITGDGTNATARAIVSPPNGHGSNAVTELFAKDISFFSSISTEKNQGFSVLNDYRQLGIIKNPQKFTSTVKLESTTASTCYSVSVDSVGITSIPNDSKITDGVGQTGNVYEVVAANVGTNTSSLLLQSIDNKPLTLNQNLYFVDSGNVERTLLVTNFTNPDANKYSGNLLFIDNRNAFLPNPEQTVSIKTAIRF